MTLTLIQTVTVLANGSDEGSGGFGLILLASGFVFYGAMYLRYRNTDKRHQHESETEATMHDVKALDRHVRHVTRAKNSRMRGANNHEVRARRTGLLESGMSDAVAGAMRRIPGADRLTGSAAPPGPPGPPPPPPAP